MFPTVGDEIGRLTEALATILALVGFLAGMNKGMLFHVRLLVKPLVTKLAGEWSDPCVDKHMGC